MTTLPEPTQTSIDVRARVGGVPFRIQSYFWVAAALLGVRYYMDPEAGSFGYFAFWMVAATVCVLLRALAQARVGRLFGMRGSIVLYGLGSQIQGVELIPRWRQRLLVYASGSIVQLLIAAGLIALTEVAPFPHSISPEWKSAIATDLDILVKLNVVWGMLTLAPIWPLDGGRMAVDVGESLLGKKGRVLALILSLAATALLSTWVVFEMSRRLSDRFDPRYMLYLVEGGTELFFCFILWLQTFRVLWPDDTSGKEVSHEHVLKK